jgi:hypothetical protein
MITYISFLESALLDDLLDDFFLGVGTELVVKGRVRGGV